MWLVAIGGSIGSLFRYLLNEIFGSDQYGVLAANIIGVAVAGFAVVYSANHASRNFQHFMLPGFCGGLTTFSSAILLTGQVCLLYLIETLLLSFLVVVVAVSIARRIFEPQL